MMPDPEPKQRPRPGEVTIATPIRLAAGGLAAATLAVGVFGLFTALFAVGVVLWYQAMFSLLVIAAAVFVGLIALGRFADGSAITLLIAAGCVAAGTVMGGIEARPNLTAAPTWAGLVRLWLIAGVGCGGLLALLAAADALTRNLRVSVPRVLIGVGLLVPLGGLAALSAWLIPGGSAAVRISVIILGGTALIALAAAAGHQFIRAFEAANQMPSDNRTPGTARAPRRQSS